MNPPRRLFKYRAFNVRSLRQFNSAEIYYAKPASFNDPLDCNPTVHVDTELAELEKLAYRMLMKRFGKERALREIGENRHRSGEYGDYKKDPEAAEYYSYQLAEDINAALSEEMRPYGVLSFASKWDCPLMWSHYGDEHRGICVEYDTADNSFSNLGAVSYSSTRAVKVSDLIKWKIDGDSNAKEVIFRTFFFSKAPQWRYEKEWRDLRPTFGVTEAPAYISSVTFGLRCDAVVVQTLVKLHAESDRDIKFFAIRPLKDSFKLTRQRVDTGEILAFGIRGPAKLEFKDVFLDES